jgi:hypothetical protein
MLAAELTGEARHHAKWRRLTAEEEAAAVAELRTLAGGRGDLLAEVAGIFEGTSEGELDAARPVRRGSLPEGRGRRDPHPVVDRRRPAPGPGGPQAAAQIPIAILLMTVPEERPPAWNQEVFLPSPARKQTIFHTIGESVCQ